MFVLRVELESEGMLVAVMRLLASVVAVFCFSCCWSVAACVSGVGRSLSWLLWFCCCVSDASGVVQLLFLGCFSGFFFVLLFVVFLFLLAVFGLELRRFFNEFKVVVVSLLLYGDYCTLFPPSRLSAPCASRA